ncbi:DUF6270 domain-containing protein [Fictibacillus sp. S7]|uniref:DUF6270 domain-containing protein n=1 Tax=Fictibacillus sp. S7 TaxID=2212476 RepID=UPI00101164AE|nr:DUF6270 domain-containing protein [Fictibacillus sp. S7]RXZ01669.1 hypothetical protein DMO16_19590 [Fictibacillus sp. S7]
MQVHVTNLGFHNGEFSVNGNTDNLLYEKGYLCFRRREIEHGLEYPEEYTFPLEWKDNEFSFTKNINEIFQGISLSEEMIWDLFLLCGTDYFKLIIDSSLQLYKSIYESMDNKLYKTKPYITGENGVSFVFQKNEIKAAVKNASFEEGVFDLTVQLTHAAVFNSEEWEAYSTRLVAKKREQEQLFEYYEKVEFEAERGINPLRFTMDFNEMLKDYSLNRKLIWDFFIQTEIDGVYIETPIICIGDMKTLNFQYATCIHNDLFRFKPYVTGKNTLSLFIRPSEIKANVSHLESINNTIKLEGAIVSNEYDVWNVDELNAQIVLKKRYMFGKEIGYYSEKPHEIPLINGQFQAELPVGELLADEVLRHKDVWDIFVRLTTLSKNTIDIVLRAERKIKDVVFTYEIMNNTLYRGKPYINGKGNISFYLIDSNKQQPDSVKVAVLGSCFSRNPFNSNSYFNPGYKKNYSCVLTQFHSSIISMVSNPATIDIDQLDDVSDYNKYFIQQDFEKTFFDQIQEQDPEYLIVDLYADAARDVMKLADDVYVSASLALRQSKHFKHYMDNELITHDNNRDYLKLWKDAMILFAEKITNYIQEDKVILNVGGFTTKYQDNDGSVKAFPREHIIRRNNYFWDQLNAWFIECLPGCKVIDLRDTSYIGQHDHPFGNTFSHYHSGYYKEFMNRLNKLVMQDLQKERHTENTNTFVLV